MIQLVRDEFPCAKYKIRWNGLNIENGMVHKLREPFNIYYNESLHVIYY